MPITIQQNVAALTSQRRLAIVSHDLGRSFERLSSGLRINRAVDDAAGLSISTGLKTDSRVYAQGVRNVNDGISYLNIAQGALHELVAINIRQFELAEQAANGVYSTSQRRALHVEANELVQEYNRIIASTGFNGRTIYSDAENIEALRIQAGYGSNGGIAFSLGAALRRIEGNGTFQSVLSFAAGSSPDFVSGDLNGDGIMDLVSHDSGSDSISIHIGNGDGTFVSRRSYDAGINPRDAMILDVNGDGRLDIINSSGTGGNSQIGVALGNGNGTFLARSAYEIGDPDTRDFDMYDANGDGAVDIIAASAGSSRIEVSFGNGNGTFRAFISYHTGNDPRQIAIGDFNGDGRNDVVSANYGGGDLTVLFGNADGSFTAEVNIINQVNPLRVSVGDVNRDGILDIISTISQQDRVGILFGNGNGTFTFRMSYATGDAPRNAVLTDVDGDDIKDLLISNSGDSTLSVLLGNANGTFRAFTSIATLNGGGGLHVSDINGDGVSDVVIGGGSIANVLLGDGDYDFAMASVDLTTATAAREELASLRAQLGRIVGEVGAIGAMQTRMGVALSNITVARENFDEAASRIVDADVAEEAATLTRRRILQQAAAGVLSQANQQPALALQLLS